MPARDAAEGGALAQADALVAARALASLGASNRWQPTRACSPRFLTPREFGALLWRELEPHGGDGNGPPPL